MESRKKLGLDKWKVQCDATVLLQAVKRNSLEVYDVTLYQGCIQFYAPVTQRHTIYQLFEQSVLITTSGMLGYLLRSLRKPSRLLCIICVFIVWYGLSHMVFAIEIKGEKEDSKALLLTTLESMNYKVPFYQQDVSDMKTKLKKKLENDISWLEIEKRGSRYILTYTPKEFATLKQPGHEELIARRDGLIERFDIQYGNKEHKVNEYVHKGDVLVSNTLLDSTGKKQEVFVKGRVFAYIWKDVSVTIPDTKMPKSFQYFELLLEARGEVSKDFKKDDRILEENILQFSKDMGKIKMVVHYKTVQDITTP